MLIVDFKKLNSINDISINFGFRSELLDEIINSENQKDYYSVLKIPKRNKNHLKKHRVVYKATEDLAGLHKNILLHLNHAYIYGDEEKNNNKYIHPSVHGFVKKRGILTNAFPHLNKKNIICIDINNFFKSIRIDDVFNVFLRLGFPRNTADIFSKICTIDGVLEEGLHASPLLANLHCHELDIAFSSLAAKYQATYTRYADDITISSNGYLPKEQSIVKILSDNQFTLNIRKTRFCSKGHAQYVTGLSVSNDLRPRLPRLKKKKLRMEFFYIKKFGLESHFEKIGREDVNSEIERLTGWVRFLNYVEPSLSIKYDAILIEAINKYLENKLGKHLLLH